jgi:hypothetical protein
MTGRERFLNLLNGLPVDRLAWNALVDPTSLTAMPPEVQALNTVEFCRLVGGDVLQLGDFALPADLVVGDPYLTRIPGVEVKEFPSEVDLWVRQTLTPWGNLTATFRNGHPLEYPVKDLEGVRILRRVWEATLYEEAGEEWERRYRRADEYIGESGIYTHFITSSPVQRLIEYEMGMMSFYSLLHDYRSEMEGLLDVMQRRWLESVSILAHRTPAEVIIPVENTSTTLISPALYARYSFPQMRAFVELVHSCGKKAVFHMCGWLKNLLPCLAETGLDGVHALTPPTVGDTPFELAMDVLGERVTLMGILEGTIFHDPNVTQREIWALLDRIYTPRVRTGNFILIVAADGLPTPLWKFQAVQEWMERWGGRQ